MAGLTRGGGGGGGASAGGASQNFKLLQDMLPSGSQLLGQQKGRTVLPSWRCMTTIFVSAVSCSLKDSRRKENFAN